MKNTTTSKKKDEKITPAAAVVAGGYQPRGTYTGERGGRARGGNESGQFNFFEGRDESSRNSRHFASSSLRPRFVGLRSSNSHVPLEAFRDREAGRHNNLSKNTEDDSAAPRARGGRGRGRQYDRHSQTGRVYVFFEVIPEFRGSSY